MRCPQQVVDNAVYSDRSLDQELENWKDLKVNSEKMLLELNDRKKNIQNELDENQKNPEKLAVRRGQNLQNLENTKKNNEELESEIQKIEQEYKKIDTHLLQYNRMVLHQLPKDSQL